MSSTHRWHTLYSDIWTLFIGVLQLCYWFCSVLLPDETSTNHLCYFQIPHIERLAQIIAIPQALTSSLYREDLVYPGKASETHTLTVNRYRETIMSIKIIRLFGLYNMLSDKGTATAFWSAQWGKRNWRIMPWWMSQRSLFTIVRRYQKFIYVC